MIYNFLNVNNTRKIVEVGRLKYSSDIPHPNRTMKVHDLVYVLNGYFDVTQEGERLRAEKGEVLFLTGGRYHYANCVSPKGTECIFIHFNMDDHDYMLQEYGEPSEDSVCIPSVLTCINDTRIDRLFQEISYLFNSSNAIHKKTSYCKLLELLLYIEQQVFNINDYNDDIVHSVVEILNKNQDRNITVDEIAREVGFSKRTIHLRFKKCTGLTVHQYQLNSKLQSIASILKDYPNMTLKEIAISYGFSDEFHLSKNFKKKFGVYPSKYREMYK